MKRILLSSLVFLLLPVFAAFAATPSSLWYPTTPLFSGSYTATGSTHGTFMTFQQDGSITDLKFFKRKGETATSRSLILWSSGGTNLASCTTSSEPNSTTVGLWVGCTLTTAYVITIGSTYVVSADYPNGQVEGYATGICSQVVSGNTAITCSNFEKANTVSTFPTIAETATDFEDVIFVPNSCPQGTCYYVSPTGLDTNTGLDTSHPWQTINKVNTSVFTGPTAIFFQGGQTFNGCLNLTYNGNLAGDIHGPTVVGSYGTGNATIVSTAACAVPRSAAIKIDGVNQITVQDITLQGGNETIATGAYSAWCSSCNPVSVPSTTGVTQTYGTKLTFPGPGNISALKFFKPSGDTTTARNLNLWNANGGASLATCATSSEAAGPAWISCNITAFTITAGNSYIVGYDVPAAGTSAFGAGSACERATTANAAVVCQGAGSAGAIGTFPGTSLSATVFADVTFNLTTAITFPITPMGVLVQNNSGNTISGVTVQRMDISNFGARNVFETAEVFVTGFTMSGVCGTVNNVSILNNTLHGSNGTGSIDSSGISGYGCNNIGNALYAGNTVYNLGGWNGVTAGAIEINQVNSGTIEWNLVHDIGANDASCGGTSGIEAYQANHFTIQFNEVYNVQPLPSYHGGCDWVAIDLDAGVNNATVQYNYTHNNFGAGLLNFVASLGGPTYLWGPNTVRYNISENDGISTVPANPIFVTTAPSTPLQIYNNSVYQKQTITNQSAFCFGFGGTSTLPPGSLFENNVCDLVPNGTGLSLFVNAPQVPVTMGGTFATNDYFGTSPIWKYKGNFQSTLSGWQTASSQDSGSITTDPKFTTPGGGGTLTWTPSLDPVPLTGPGAYLIQATSPLIGTGTAIAGNGGDDYYQNDIPLTGVNIGADQTMPAPTPHVKTPVDGMLCTNPSQTGCFQLIFDEEFNGTSLDTTKWHSDSGSGLRGGTNFCYDPANVTVNTHELDLTVTAPGTLCSGFLGSGARIHTGPSASGATFTCSNTGQVGGQTWGFCAGPNGSGTPPVIYGETLYMNPCDVNGNTQDHAGFWWVGNGNWPNTDEYDIFTTTGAPGASTQVDGRVYSTGNTGGIVGLPATAACGYHLFAAKWIGGTSPSMEWWLDGQKLGSNNSVILTFPAEFFLELNNAGTAGSPINNSVIGAVAKVKYMHIYGMGVTYPPAAPETNYGGPGDLAGKTLGGT